MGDGKSTENAKTVMTTTSSVEDVSRQMVLLEIEQNEKSHFDDVITGAESSIGWEDCWKDETEDSVRSVPSEWSNDEMPSEVTISPVQTPQEANNVYPTALNSYYTLMDLNDGEAMTNTVRMARVPSQYQLDALYEMFIFDAPQQQFAMIPAVNHTPSENIPRIDDGTPYFVNSEYVSELLM